MILFVNIDNLTNSLYIYTMEKLQIYNWKNLMN